MPTTYTLATNAYTSPKPTPYGAHCIRLAQAMYRFSGNKAVTPREAMYALVVYAHWGGLPECFGTNHKAISRAATMIADISTLLAF